MYCGRPRRKLTKGGFWRRLSLGCKTLAAEVSLKQQLAIQDLLSFLIETVSPLSGRQLTSKVCGGCGDQSGHELLGRS